MASKAGKGVGKFVGGTYKRSLKGSAAGGLMGAMTAGMVSGGDSTAVVGGYMAGSALSSGVKGNVSNKIEERRDAREERENNALLAGAYANLKESGGYTDAQMSEMTNNLLNDQEGLYNMARINGESEEDWFNRTATAEEKQLEKDGEYGKDVWRDRMAYSQSLYATQSRYESRGLSSEASADKVMDTIKQVQSGRISSKGSTEANYNSAKKDEVSAERKRRADEVAGYMDSMWE